MTNAIPLDTIRDYLERQLEGYGPPPQPGAVIEVERVWLEWLWRKDLQRAQNAGVGAVLASDLDTGLKQFALLGEQLHAQAREGVVPRSLTEHAVAPYWSGATGLSAYAGGRSTHHR